MAFVSSSNQIVVANPYWSPGIIRNSIILYDKRAYSYAAMYRMQPNLRTCIDFLARNVAQVGLYGYRRISDTDRQRIQDGPLAMLLKQPTPARYKVAQYHLIENMMSDLGLYGNAFWLKLMVDGNMTLMRVPPPHVEVTGGLVPTNYRVSFQTRQEDYTPEQVVHFKNYNPENPIVGLSMAETLRRTLAEEQAAGSYREYFWQNAARMDGIIKRPMAAPEWSDTALQRFRSQFEDLYSGEENSGRTAVLEDGMEWESISFSAREAEYLGGRKLTREECARAYHIPPPLVGILDHATFSNIQEQHKHLYQDTLGPYLTMIEQSMEQQLLPDLGDVENVYLEFNIGHKLEGSFEEQTKALQSAVGRPWMTPNEARSKLNLSSLDGDADLLATPLNVLIGGQASPQDSAPEQRNLPLERKAIDPTAQRLRERHQQKWADALTNHYRRQERVITSRVPKAQKSDIGGVWWDDDRWDSELKSDLLRLNLNTATAFADEVYNKTGSSYSVEVMLPWLDNHSRIQAEGINTEMRDTIAAALNEPDALDAVKTAFALAATTWAAQKAVTAVTSVANFGTNEAAKAGGLRSKTWRTNSGNPRPEHSALNGVTVGIGDVFPNGMKWPGDPAGSADDVAGCQCSVIFN